MLDSAGICHYHQSLCVHPDTYANVLLTLIFISLVVHTLVNSELTLAGSGDVLS